MGIGLGSLDLPGHLAGLLPETPPLGLILGEHVCELRGSLRSTGGTGELGGPGAQVPGAQHVLPRPHLLCLQSGEQQWTQ